ncbi:MAG: electron transfer flavoprotein subunit alpha/FixB family protein [Desulfocapsaceae bacterium]|nr:electron transfer flavoprotein subunit alpha/FixB family protein [Desulfocapsaceae bacterium]
MKTLLVAEYREGRLQNNVNDLMAFANKAGADSTMFLVGSKTDLPQFQGKLYLADTEKCGEYNPEVHKELLLDVVAKVKPDMVIFSHSSYGWDLAPRVAFALKATQISEVVDFVDGVPIVPVCNSKLRRKVTPKTDITVLTLQAGAFSLTDQTPVTPIVEMISTPATGTIRFGGYEQAEKGGIDLTKAQVIVSAGRGIGKPENIGMIAKLAQALKGEYGASRPVVDSEWAEHNRQVGTTGQTVSPKLYMACGISGAIQHLAGMKKSEFVVAINTDKDAPIGEMADVLVVVDLKQFIPLLTERILAL